jgi:L-ascorbate metabolism protein UlaG (beta-lactamase superfamily)
MTAHPETPRRPARRRALKVLGGLGLAGLGGGFALAPPQANAYYQGPVSDHFDGVRFFNPGGPGPKSFRQLMRWQFSTRAEAWPAQFPAPQPVTPPPSVDGGRVRVTFIGHASYLVQTAGRNILIDPVYAERVSPVSFAGPRRVNAPGIALDKLPRIDSILITHNHYDHMDTDAIGRLAASHPLRIVTPLGNDAILKAAVPVLDGGAAGSKADRIIAVDWGGATDLGGGVSVHTVPTQHWSARGTRDRQHALWASFVIRAGARTLYCIGDTGFGDGRTFRHVAGRFAGIDLALLPIGAYEPRWFMRDQHMNPAEAVEVFEIVGAGRALGHHWGTFKLTNEGIEQPRVDLARALVAKGIAPERFIAARPGDVAEIG